MTYHSSRSTTRGRRPADIAVRLLLGHYHPYQVSPFSRARPLAFANLHAPHALPTISGVTHAAHGYRVSITATLTSWGYRITQTAPRLTVPPPRAHPLTYDPQTHLLYYANGATLDPSSRAYPNALGATLGRTPPVYDPITQTLLWRDDPLRFAFDHSGLPVNLTHTPNGFEFKEFNK